jgi:predicted branched-subunit amino acid permease
MVRARKQQWRPGLCSLPGMYHPPFGKIPPFPPLRKGGKRENGIALNGGEVSIHHAWRYSTAQKAPPDPTPLALFVRGFGAMVPLWTGAIPIGIAYGVAARGAGLGLGATLLMSLTVFSAATQVSAVSLLSKGTAGVVLLGVALALNAQFLLLGLAIGRQTRPSPLGRLLAAYFLTDAAYGVALTGGRLRLPRLVGAGVSMFVAWNLGTALGATAVHALPDLRRLGVDFVVPLTFLAVLVPLLRTRAAALTALVAGVVTLLMVRLAPSGVVVLSASLTGSAVGAWWARRAGTGPSAARDIQ